MNNLNFEVYNCRRDDAVTYRVNKTDNGWHISHIAINGDCEPDGSPYFYINFKQDYINYPSGFGNSLEWLWKQIENQAVDHEEAQVKLQELADWVSVCEKEQPQWQGWNA
jgi:hypothetical protein